MNKVAPVIFLGLIFFTFLIGRVEGAYDRIHPQFFYLSIINLSLILYIFYKFPLKKILSIIGVNKLFLLYCLYILFSVISLLFATNQVEALIVLSQYLTFFASYLIIILVISLYKIDYIKILIYFSSLAVLVESIGVLYSVFDFVVVNGNSFQRSNNFSGFSGNINITAFSIAIKSSFIYYLLFKRGNGLKKNIIYTIILLMASSSLFFLLTRGAFIAFIVLSFIICFFLIYINYDGKTLRLKIISSLLTLFLSYFLVSEIISNENPSNLIDERVSSISLNSEDQSIGQRLRYYNLSLNIISNNLFTGIGVGNWKFMSIEYDASNIEEYTVPYHAHNDFLQILSEIGIFGGLAYIGIFFMALIVGVNFLFKSDDKLLIICLLGSLVVYGIDSMLNFPVARPISHLYFLFLLAGFSKINKLK